MSKLPLTSDVHIAPFTVLTNTQCFCFSFPMFSHIKAMRSEGFFKFNSMTQCVHSYTFLSEDPCNNTMKQSVQLQPRQVRSAAAEIT